jgi:hypothetical protein
MAKYKPKRKQNKGGVSQMWPCHLHEKSMYLKAKERIMETQIFHGAKIYNLPQNSSPLKRNQNPSKIL